jgi:hypothetical protein
MEQYNIKSKTNYRRALKKNVLMQKSKQTNQIMIIIIIIITIIISLTQIEVIIIIIKILRDNIIVSNL